MNPHEGLPFLKGHGTGNDFVVVADFDDTLTLTPQQVSSICDRHRGIGADGLLRVVRQGGMYFMDYRNADGSLAETCGNGLRVFARFLVENGLEKTGAFSIRTRAGVVQATVGKDDLNFDNIAINMGAPEFLSTSLQPVVKTETGSWNAVAVAMPNPHCVTVVDDMKSAGALLSLPIVTPAEVFPDGVNVEFIESRGSDHIGMRTFERGVGETLACGSGACAAASVWANRNDLTSPWTVQVDILGGTVFVDGNEDGSVTLRGPARFVASGVIDSELVAF